jgi:uncharacterized protein YpmS
MAQFLDTKWNNFQRTISRSKPGIMVTITMTQEAVNSKINAGLGTANLPARLSVSNLNVNLKGGQIILSADMTYSIFSGTAAMTATVAPVNGQPVITVTDVNMGTLPLPESLKNQLKELIPENSLFQSSSSEFTHRISRLLTVS